MADPVWDGMLGQLGFNARTVAEFRLYNLNSFGSMIMMSKEELKQTMDSLLKYPHPERAANAVVFISPLARQNLESAMYWAVLTVRSGLLPEPDNLQFAQLAHARLRLQELDMSKKAEKTQDIAKPPKLKKLREWKRFWEACLTYFGSIRGAADLPLTWIFRDEAVVEAEALAVTYHSNDARYS
jgi:hypothetical protein